MDYISAEIKSMVDMLPQVGLLDVRPMLRQQIEDGKQKWMSGIQMGAQHKRICKRLKKIDPYLILRYDYDRAMYAVDRADPQSGVTYPIFYWSHPLGDGEEICKVLHENDMQRYSSPEAYVEHKRQLATKVRENNSKKSDDAILGAVDQLSDKQVKQFVEVHEAMASGEKVRCYGKDADFMNKTLEQNKAGILPPNEGQQAMNPGMKPGVYQRDRQRNEQFEDQP